MERTILWSVNEGVGRFTFNRPDHANSMCLAVRSDMLEGIQRMIEPDVRVLVISGNGKFFNTGGDITEFRGNLEKLDGGIDEVLKFMQPSLYKLATLPIPVISAINGPLAGAGIGFALCADFVLASDTAKLRGGFCGIGLSPDMASSYFLTRRIGAAKAKQIFMLNRVLSAQECLHLGIVDQVHPAAHLTSAVDDLAAELAAGPTSCYGRVKRLCDSAHLNDLQTHLDLEHKLQLQSARSTECKEGVLSYIEGRAPDFPRTLNT